MSAQWASSTSSASGARRRGSRSASRARGGRRTGPRPARGRDRSWSRHGAATARRRRRHLDATGSKSVARRRRRTRARARRHARAGRASRSPPPSPRPRPSARLAGPRRAFDQHRPPAPAAERSSAACSAVISASRSSSRPGRFSAGRDNPSGPRRKILPLRPVSRSGTFSPSPRSPRRRFPMSTTLLDTGALREEIRATYRDVALDPGGELPLRDRPRRWPYGSDIRPSGWTRSRPRRSRRSPASATSSTSPTIGPGGDGSSTSARGRAPTPSRRRTWRAPAGASSAST